MVLNIFSFVDDSQNTGAKFTNIFLMRVVDHERKIQYDWPNKTLFSYGKICLKLARNLPQPVDPCKTNIECN